MKPSVRDQLLDDFPWLTARDFEEAAGAIEDTDTESEDDEKKPAAIHPKEPPPPKVVDSDEFERLRLEMLEKRAEFALADDDKFFFIRQRGGAANIAKIGTALDCCAMYARKGIAMEFCEKFGFPKQKSYHYSKYGGEIPANLLIREFARKGHFFCCLWLAHDCDHAYSYSDEDVKCYPSSPEFLDFMCGLPPESVAFAAGKLIDDWRPAVYKGAV